MGFDGYAPIAGYLAEEGCCLGLELRPGTQHSASETPDFLKRLLPRARAVSSLPLLVRADSGFDGAAIFVAMAEARASGALDWLVKWNPRGFDTDALHQHLAADPATAWTQPREGKRETFMVETILQSQYPRACSRASPWTCSGQPFVIALPSMDGLLTRHEQGLNKDSPVSFLG